MIQNFIAILCLIWYIFIFGVCAIGIYQILYYYIHPLRPSPSEISAEDPASWVPHITVIRPVKGVEPYLYECLASTFRQVYPAARLTIYFCISNSDDPALPVIRRLLADFRGFDAGLFIEEEDPNLAGERGISTNLGPNPKIRNMSRAYRKAKGDIMWIVDCNVWVGPSTANCMVDTLCGFTMNSTAQERKKYMFVHQLPLSIDLTPPSTDTSIWSSGGGLLEETFLSTAHAKFYTAINTVAVAPCIVGKSNMFRRSHLNALTSPPSPTNPTSTPPPGIDYFSHNICEDHLIGDLLWKSPVPSTITSQASKEGSNPNSSSSSNPHPTTWGKHAMLPPTSPANLAIQPTATYPLATYIDRRTRWLRVRKFTVTLATLIEPGTESFLCSAYAAFAATTLPWFHTVLHIPQTWSAFAAFWLCHVFLWSCVDYGVWRMLHTSRDDDGGGGGGGGGRPPFAKTREERRPWWQWELAWLGREALALPIWIWAILGGVTVVWRGRRFWVGVDMRVHEIEGGGVDEGGGEGWGARGGGEEGGGGNGSGSGSGGESGGRKRRRD